MLNVFHAGTNVVRSEVTALSARGPYRLTIQHGQGTIVEYFATPSEALERQAELEDLLTSARGGLTVRKERV
jgi:hypothetical protein